MNNPEDTKGVSFEVIDGREVYIIGADNPEYADFAREAADQNYPAGARRIEQLTMLLSTGIMLNDYGAAETTPTNEQVEAAESTAEGIVDVLIYGVPPQLAAFLKDGQAAEVADQIDGWLALATRAA